MKNLIALLLLTISLNTINAQSLVSGKIIDGSTKSPLAGATIVEKGTKNGVTADHNGLFQLHVSDSSASIVVSFIGYLTEEIVVQKETTSLQISMLPDLMELEEVVTIGYGTNPLRALSGKVAGLVISNGRKRKSNYQPAIYGSYSTLPETNTESYAHTTENSFKPIGTNPLSTFSIDVDRASYSNVRRFVNNGQKPPVDAIRVEEMINYFHYNYPETNNEHPINIFTEVSSCPWNEKHLLMHIGMKALEVDESDLPPSNMVFLIDVSGSMSSSNKLPLVKCSLNMLTDQLREEDRVAIVVYAGAAGLVLPSTSGAKKEKIREAIDQLQAGGSTAGGAGIKLAYKVATENYKKNGNNRIIIATDGDFNVGASSDNAMEELIKEKKESGIYLTCLGYGMGNYKDSKLETLANKGNGNYAYIDNIQEAEKTLVEEFGGTLFTIAKDVKIQIEFNPAYVNLYRLVGYENRLLNDEDFNDDTKDAGEVGAGHTVTALYEIIPNGVKSDYSKNIDKLKYQESVTVNNSELATVKVRYKQPKALRSIYFDKPVSANQTDIEMASENLRFSASVAMFGMLLSGSDYVKKINYDDIIALVSNARADDKDGYKAEFIRLVKSAKSYR